MHDKYYEKAGLTPSAVEHLNGAADRLAGESHNQLTQGVMFDLVAALCCEVAHLSQSARRQAHRPNAAPPS